MTKNKKLLLAAWLLVPSLLAACGPQNTGPGIWIDAPLEGAALTEGVHPVTVHASWDGELGAIGISLSHPGFVYARYAAPPGEPLNGTTFIANFEWVTETFAIAEVPFPFNPVGNPPPEGKYTLQACLFGPQPQFEVLSCSEIFVYMPRCGPGEVSLGPDCIPAALDETQIPEFIPDDFVAIPNRNANCRLGPSASLFEIDDTLLMGVEYAPLAQGPDGMWLLFQGPISQNLCWVFSDNLDLFCQENAVTLASVAPCVPPPIEDYPALPTLTPTPTFTPEAEVTETPDLPECSDGIDNDGDGDIDLADGRCLDANDDTENR